MDDDDLVASALPIDDSGSGSISSEQRAACSATVFASLSLGISRASFVVAEAFEAYSRPGAAQAVTIQASAYEQSVRVVCGPKCAGCLDSFVS